MLIGLSENQTRNSTSPFSMKNIREKPQLLTKEFSQSHLSGFRLEQKVNELQSNNSINNCFLQQRAAKKSMNSPTKAKNGWLHKFIPLKNIDHRKEVCYTAKRTLWTNDLQMFWRLTVQQRNDKTIKTSYIIFSWFFFTYSSIGNISLATRPI